MSALRHDASPPSAAQPVRITRHGLETFCRLVLAAAGADETTASAATRAMMHGSLLGIDSHGVRLTGHYVKAIEGGRVNGRPRLTVTPTASAAAILDGDDGHGAVATYAAMERACQLAERAGVGAVAIRRSSHFGAAGAYALAAAEAGLIGIAVCNSDSFMRLHGGAERFHGTNPIAAAVPVGGQRPWLLDMATSAIPYNRVLLYRSLGLALPEGVASDGEGIDIDDPHGVEMLAPLGGAFGHKGAGLAGLVEILSAVLTGMKLSFDIAPMGGPDFATPRAMGAFVIAIRPEAFIARETFEAAMHRYLDHLRSSRTAPGAAVMAPGDREWAEADRRALAGVPVDPVTIEDFTALSKRLGIAMPAFDCVQ
ncbi:MAG: putative malate / lactate dehydrogenase [Xanthobacteraceae bacterium]|nr:MAG: putative malate / lactate dehydrogenase [Xanthobacteraceae bacterium]